MEILDTAHQEKLRNQLSKAERHIAEGEARITRRRELIEQREGVSADSEGARDSLRQFQELQKLHLADRDRLRGELRLWEEARAAESIPITESPPTSPSTAVATATPFKDKNVSAELEDRCSRQF